jgi:inhibitor of cysteine peptidase
MKTNDYHWNHIQNIRACIVYVTIVILLLSSCGTDTGKNTMSNFTLTEDDQGKTITIHPSDQVVISLTENPTTGFRWIYDPIDSELLALNSNASGYTPSPGGAIGSGGKHTWTFDAKRPGTVHLQFKLWRSWEGDASIRRRFDVTVQIQR